jgi:hypothetical protein
MVRTNKYSVSVDHKNSCRQSPAVAVAVASTIMLLAVAPPLTEHWLHVALLLAVYD